MRIIVASLLLLACWIASPAHTASIDFGRYHALVIGINDYKHLPALETAVNDAEAVAKLLETKYGFKVRLLRNASKRDIVRAVNDYRSNLTERDNLLIYYAGHGWLDPQTKTGYWQPVDAENDDDFNWIANSELTRRLNAMSVMHVMVIADSCYSGTLVRQSTSRLSTGAERDAWLKRMAEKRSRTAIVSGGLEPVADTGRSGHSVFANALINTLEGNAEILEGHELFRRISRPVVVNSDQTPQYSDIRRAGHEGGEFIFVPQGSTVLVVPPVQSGKTDLRTMELALWNSVKDSAEQAALQAYLDQFPNGTFARVAQLKLEKLTAATKTQTAMVTPSPPTVEVDEIDETFIAIKNANLRSAPSTKSKKVTTVNKGTEVAVTGKVRDTEWYRIEHDGADSYVYAPLLQERGAWEEAQRREAEERKQAEEQELRKEEERRRVTEEAKRQAEERRKAEAEAQRHVREKAWQRAEKRQIEARRQQAATATPPKPVAPPPSAPSPERKEARATIPTHESDGLVAIESYLKTREFLDSLANYDVKASVLPVNYGGTNAYMPVALRAYELQPITADKYRAVLSVDVSLTGRPAEAADVVLVLMRSKQGSEDIITIVGHE